MKTFAVLALATGLVVNVWGCGKAAKQEITQEELVRRTQELMDSVVPGNQGPWKKYFADDAMYFDEKGRDMDKEALVKDVSPMPTGYSGAIRVANVKSRMLGDTAILSYDLDETETIFGQNLKARYHGTDTWMRKNGEWKIVAGQMLRYYEDPATGTLDLARIKPFLGHYQLAPGSVREVSTDGKSVFMQRTGHKKEELLPEGADIFFRKGVEGRILFRHGANDQPNLLIDRRNNEDVVWKRVN